jgi:hypothetical protein
MGTHSPLRIAAAILGPASSLRELTGRTPVRFNVVKKSRLQQPSSWRASCLHRISALFRS